MSDNIKLSSFPENRVSALTMLFLRSKDLSDVTPEKLVDMYNETYQIIKERFKETSFNRASYLP